MRQQSSLARLLASAALTAILAAGLGGGDLAHLTADGLHGIDQISEIILNLKNFSRLDRSKPHPGRACGPSCS